MSGQTIRRSTALVVIAAILVIVAIAVVIRVRSAQSRARVLHYKSILAQAPCIGSVCPGMEGRNRLKEDLANEPNIGLISDNGGKRVSFSFASTNPKALGNDSIGGGALEFSDPSQGQEQILESISFHLSRLQFNAIIDVLGEPDRYLYISGCGMGNRVFGILLYSTIHTQVIVNYQVREPNTEQLSPKTSIEGLQYSTASSYKPQLLDMLDTAILESVAFDLRPDIDTGFLLSHIQPWPGIAAAPTPSVDLCPR